MDRLARLKQLGGDVAAELALIYRQTGHPVIGFQHHVLRGQVVEGVGLYVFHASLAGAEAEHLHILGGFLLHQDLHHVDVAGVFRLQELAGGLLWGGWDRRLPCGGGG